MTDPQPLGHLGVVPDLPAQTRNGTERAAATPEAIAAAREQVSEEDMPDRALTHDAKVLREVERKLVSREADEIIAARNAEPLRKLSAAEFLASPPPSYLIPKMLPTDGLSTVFGPPGEGKSFFMLDIALSLASGRPWFGHKLSRTRVHYVMAEGQATNNLRTQAWLVHHGVPVPEIDGRFDVYPQSILLTDAGTKSYLPDVRADEPGLIVLDTKNLMFEGQESAGDAGGAMLRVLHRIRREAGGACVVLVDHTGLFDNTRVRGSNSQKGGVETEVQILGDDSGVRTATVFRDKSGLESPAPRWSYRLHPVPEVPAPPHVMTPAVCVPIDPLSPDAPAPSAASLPEWWVWARDVELPAEVNEKIDGIDLGANGNRGRDAARTLALFFMWVATANASRTLAQCAAELNDAALPKKTRTSPKSTHRAWDILGAAELIKATTSAPSGTGAHAWDGPKP